MDRVTRLAEELDDFHRGRGFNADAIVDRVGPLLAAIVFGDNEGDPASGRDLLRRWLLAAATDLPEDLRSVFLAASGLRDLSPQLTDRLATLATTGGVSARTVRRRLREADRLVAASLIARSSVSEDENPFTAPGWYVDRLDALADLTEDRPRFRSLREIIVTHEGVNQICESWSIPKPPHEPHLTDLHLEATEGCEVTQIEKVSPSTWRVTLGLTATLAPRQRHRVGFTVTLPSRAYVRPYNAFVPVRRTRSFRSEVCFGPGSGITGAWRVDGLPPLAMDDGVPVGEMFDLEAGSPLVAEWSTVRRGLAYGIGWSW